MSHFLDFTASHPQFSDGHGAVTDEDRQWEDAYRQRWQHDKIIRSTHGVNCTESCSWKISQETQWKRRHRHVGNAADGLSAHPARHAQSPAAWMLARRILFVVPL
ncbi:hypothetical protein OKW43_001910 [Paraburkholderia sp. WC7.3g]